MRQPSLEHLALRSASFPHAPLLVLPPSLISSALHARLLCDELLLLSSLRRLRRLPARARPLGVDCAPSEFQPTVFPVCAGRQSRRPTPTLRPLSRKMRADPLASRPCYLLTLTLVSTVLALLVGHYLDPRRLASQPPSLSAMPRDGSTSDVYYERTSKGRPEVSSSGSRVSRGSSTFLVGRTLSPNADRPTSLAASTTARHVQRQDEGLINAAVPNRHHQPPSSTARS